MSSDKNPPLVSVCLVTYNHAPYIRQSIEGILSQNANFPFEIVIGDDGSDDGTTDICMEYKARHPDIIQLFSRSRGDVFYVDGYPTARNNVIKTFRSCAGRYIAYCEGDDYWQDPLKLQKQVDFLGSHPDYGMVHSVADTFYQAKDRFKRYKGGYNPPQGHIYNDLFLKMRIYSSSVCCRAELAQAGINELEKCGDKWLSGDIALWLIAAHSAKAHYMDEPLIVYRILENSASHTTDIVRIIKFGRSMLRIYLHFLDKFGGPVNRASLYGQYLNYCYREISKVPERVVKSTLRRLRTP